MPLHNELATRNNTRRIFNSTKRKIDSVEAAITPNESFTTEQIGQYIHNAQFSQMYDAVYRKHPVFTTHSQPLVRGFQYAVDLIEEYLSAVEILQKAHTQHTTEVFNAAIVSCMIASPVLRNIEHAHILSDSIMHMRILLEDILLHRYTVVGTYLPGRLRSYYRLNELIQLLALLHSTQCDAQQQVTTPIIGSVINICVNDTQQNATQTQGRDHAAHNRYELHMRHNTPTTTHMCNIKKIIMQYIQNNRKLGLYDTPAMRAQNLKLYTHMPQVLVHIDILCAMQVFVTYAARRELRHIMQLEFCHNRESALTQNCGNNSVLRYVCVAQVIHMHYTHVMLAHYSNYIASVGLQTRGAAYENAAAVMHIMTHVHSISLHIAERLIAYTRGQMIMYMLHTNMRATQGSISSLACLLNTHLIHSLSYKIVHLVFKQDIVSIVLEKLNELHVKINSTVLNDVVPKIFAQFSTSCIRRIHTYIQYMCYDACNDDRFIEEAAAAERLVQTCLQYDGGRACGPYLLLHFDNGQIVYDDYNVTTLTQSVYTRKARRHIEAMLENLCEKAYAHDANNIYTIHKICAMSPQHTHVYNMLRAYLLQLRT